MRGKSRVGLKFRTFSALWFSEFSENFLGSPVGWSRNIFSPAFSLCCIDTLQASHTIRHTRKSSTLAHSHCCARLRVTLVRAVAVAQSESVAPASAPPPLARDGVHAQRQLLSLANIVPAVLARASPPRRAIAVAQSESVASASAPPPPAWETVSTHSANASNADIVPDARQRTTLYYPLWAAAAVPSVCVLSAAARVGVARAPLARKAFAVRRLR